MKHEHIQHRFIGREMTLTFGGEKIKGNLTKDLEMTNKEKYIPKVGEKCILQSYGFTEFNKEVRIDYMGKKVGCYTTLENGEDYTFSISDVTFRPIPTKSDVEREQLKGIIDKTRTLIEQYSDKLAIKIQNAGFTIPKKVKFTDLLCAVVSTSTMTAEKDNELANVICELLGDLVEDD